MGRPPAASVTVVGAAAAAGVAALAIGVRLQDPLPGEEAVLREAVVGEGGWRTASIAVASASDLLPLVAVVVVGALVLVVTGHRRAVVVLALSCGLVWLLNPVLKSLVARARPDDAVLPGELSEHSFPSGHAANSAVVACGAVLAVLAIAGTRAATVAACVAAVGVLVVAAAQLALGRHYPSDLIAGWLEAVAVVALVVLGVRIAEHRRAKT